MNRQEFSVQVDRLKDRYGDRPYTEIVIKTLWDEFDWMDRVDFAGLVNLFLTESHRPPLLKEFREQAGRLRLNRWQQEKKQEANDAKNTMKYLSGKEASKKIGEILKAIF